MPTVVCAFWMAATRSLLRILVVLMPRLPASCCSSGRSIDANEARFPARPDRLLSRYAEVTPRLLLGVCHGDVGSFRGGSLIVARKHRW